MTIIGYDIPPDSYWEQNPEKNEYSNEQHHSTHRVKLPDYVLKKFQKINADFAQRRNLGKKRELQATG